MYDLSHGFQCRFELIDLDRTQGKANGAGNMPSSRKGLGSSNRNLAGQ